MIAALFWTFTVAALVFFTLIIHTGLAYPPAKYTSLRRRLHLRIAVVFSGFLGSTVGALATGVAWIVGRFT